jgi:hypothetical protein
VCATTVAGRRHMSGGLIKSLDIKLCLDITTAPLKTPRRRGEDNIKIDPYIGRGMK